jgi:hypothetical protein
LGSPIAANPSSDGRSAAIQEALDPDPNKFPGNLMLSQAPPTHDVDSGFFSDLVSLSDNDFDLTFPQPVPGLVFTQISPGLPPALAIGGPRK